jgi:hypothetical protein
LTGLAAIGLAFDMRYHGLIGVAGITGVTGIFGIPGTVGLFVAAAIVRGIGAVVRALIVVRLLVFPALFLSPAFSAG